MNAKRVDLVHYVNGERVVIGKAVVEFDGTHVDITAKITHDDGSGIYGSDKELKQVSVSFGPLDAKRKK